MTIYNFDIKALHLDMARVLNDAEYVIRHLRGQKKVKRLVEQDVCHLRDQLKRLDKHLEQLNRLQSENKSTNNQLDFAPGPARSTVTSRRDRNPNGSGMTEN